MPRVFLDTSALVALAMERDDHHARAVDVLQELAESKASLWTSSYVVVEHVSILHNRRGISAVRAFLHHFLPHLEVLWIDPPLHEGALALLLKTGKRRLSLVDCSSFLLLRKEHQRDVFAFDPDFEFEGFRVLR